MDRFGPTLIILAVVVLVFAAMWWGWRRRGRRDAALQPTWGVPSDLGTQHATLDADYVATTEHGKPLERLAIKGLAFRGRAEITAADAGIVIAVTGEKSVFIAAAAIVAVGVSNVAIDRVVESGGLVRIAWHINAGKGDGTGPIVDSYLRVVDSDDRLRLLDALGAITPATAGDTDSSDDTESEV